MEGQLERRRMNPKDIGFTKSAISDASRAPYSELNLQFGVRGLVFVVVSVCGFAQGSLHRIWRTFTWENDLLIFSTSEEPSGTLWEL